MFVKIIDKSKLWIHGLLVLLSLCMHASQGLQAETVTPLRFDEQFQQVAYERMESTRQSVAISWDFFAGRQLHYTWSGQSLQSQKIRHEKDKAVMLSSQSARQSGTLVFNSLFDQTARVLWTYTSDDSVVHPDGSDEQVSSPTQSYTLERMSTSGHIRARGQRDARLQRWLSLPRIRMTIGETTLVPLTHTIKPGSMATAIEFHTDAAITFDQIVRCGTQRCAELHVIIEEAGDISDNDSIDKLAVQINYVAKVWFDIDNHRLFDLIALEKTHTDADFNNAITNKPVAISHRITDHQALIRIQFQEELRSQHKKLTIKKAQRYPSIRKN